MGVSAGGVANEGHFHSVSLCLCVCFGSECGGRRVWGWMEEDEEVNKLHILQTELFIHVFTDLW